jgi:hypothetical protein
MPHDDIREVNGKFERDAHKITLFSRPGKDGTSGIALLAAGEGTGRIVVQADNSTIVRTGGTPIPESVGHSGVTVYAPDAAILQLQRGNFDDPGSQRVQMRPDGTIVVDAGQSGAILLSAGDSFISITPTAITIKAALVKIN